MSSVCVLLGAATVLGACGGGPDIRERAWWTESAVGEPAPSSLADTVERVAPATVAIALELPMAPGERRITGSGFIIRSDGYILTNAHVARSGLDAQLGFATTVDLPLWVRLYDGRYVPAEVVSLASGSDTALLRVQVDEPLPTVVLGDSDLVRPGETVFLVGSPYARETAVMSGVVSNTAHDVATFLETTENVPTSELWPRAAVIEYNALTGGGSSGAAVFNARGEVIAINFASQYQFVDDMDSPSGRARVERGYGWGVPVNQLKSMLPSMFEGGEPGGRLGVRVDEIRPQDSTAFSALRGGVLPRISHVQEDGPAARAGLQVGDVIERFDVHRMDRAYELEHVLRITSPGHPVTIEVFRPSASCDETSAQEPCDGEHMSFDVVLEPASTASVLELAASLRDEVDVSDRVCVGFVDGMLAAGFAEGDTVRLTAPGLIWGVDAPAGAEVQVVGGTDDQVVVAQDGTPGDNATLPCPAVASTYHAPDAWPDAPDDEAADLAWLAGTWVVRADVLQAWGYDGITDWSDAPRLSFADDGLLTLVFNLTWMEGGLPGFDIPWQDIRSNDGRLELIETPAERMVVHRLSEQHAIVIDVDGSPFPLHRDGTCDAPRPLGPGTTTDFMPPGTGTRSWVRGAGGSTVFAFTPPEDGTWCIETVEAEFDTFLGVRTTCSPGDGELAGDDDGGDGLLSRTSVPMSAGTTYLIEVSGYGTDDVGTFDLDVRRCGD